MRPIRKNIPEQVGAESAPRVSRFRRQAQPVSRGARASNSERKVPICPPVFEQPRVAGAAQMRAPQAHDPYTQAGERSRSSPAGSPTRDPGLERPAARRMFVGGAHSGWFEAFQTLDDRQSLDHEFLPVPTS